MSTRPLLSRVLKKPAQRGSEESQLERIKSGATVSTTMVNLLKNMVCFGRLLWKLCCLERVVWELYMIQPFLFCLFSVCVVVCILAVRVRVLRDARISCLRCVGVFQGCGLPLVLPVLYVYLPFSFAAWFIENGEEELFDWEGAAA